MKNDLFEYSIIEKNVCIDKYIGKETKVVIPEIFEGKPVTRIGSCAFEECSSLTSITIPEGVISIGDDAFYGCSSLTSIDIPSSVTSIEKYAFSGCSSLTSVVIPSSVTSIEKYAFSGCSSLTSITIPEGVTSIGYSAFEGCSSLTSITIPEGVTSIKEDAFNGCSSLTSVTIPEGVTSIGDDAFYECSSLTSITIPKSVTSIGSCAFGGCSGLSSITVEQGNAKFHSEWNCIIETKTKTLILGCKNSIIPSSVKSIGRSAFSGCSNLTSIVVSNGVTSIGDHAFYRCSSLTSIDIPSNVTSIGNWAFSRCSSLTSITIPNSVTSIDSYAFASCEQLTVYLRTSKYKDKYFFDIKNVFWDVKSFGETDNFEWVLFNNDTIGISNYLGNSKDVVIPEQINGNLVVEICNFAFENSNIEKLILPDTVVYVDRKALNNCKKLKEIKAPKGVKINASCTVEYVDVSYENKIQLVEKYFKKKPLKDEFILDLIGYVNENYEKFDKDILAKFYKLLKNRKKDLIANLKIIDIEKRLQDISEDIKPDFVYEGNKLVGVNDKVNIIKIPDNCEIDLNAFEKCKAKKIKVADTNNSLTAEFLSKAVLSDTIKEFEIPCDTLIGIKDIGNITITKQIQDILKIIKLNNKLEGNILSKILIKFDRCPLDDKLLQLCELSDDDIRELNSISFNNVICEESFNKIKLTNIQYNMLSFYVSKYLKLNSKLINVVFKDTGNKVPFEAMLLLAFKITQSKIDIYGNTFKLYNLIDVDSLQEYIVEDTGLMFSNLSLADRKLTEARKLIRHWNTQNLGYQMLNALVHNNNLEVLMRMMKRNVDMMLTVGITEMDILGLRPISLDENGEIIYDYGDKQIQVQLMSNLKFEITDLTNNKRLRTLPKASKNEDPKEVEAILKDYANTKEMVKYTSEYYTKQFKDVLESGERVYFGKLMDNVVTKIMSTGILWGKYNLNRNLKCAFRIIDKDNYVDINGNKVIIDNSDVISIVDASQLSIEDIRTWKQILWGENKAQLVKQFEAPIYYVPLDKLKQRYLGRDISRPGYFTTDCFVLHTLPIDEYDESKTVKEVRIKPFEFTNMNDYGKRLLNRSIIKADKAVNIEKSVEELVVKGDLQGIKTAKETAIITADNIAHLSNVAIKQKNAEVTAYLMELKKDMIGDIVDLDWEI